MTTKDVIITMDSCNHKVSSGEMSLNKANTLVRICNTTLRAINTNSTERPSVWKYSETRNRIKKFNKGK